MLLTASMLLSLTEQNHTALLAAFAEQRTRTSSDQSTRGWCHLLPVKVALYHIYFAPQGRPVSLASLNQRIRLSGKHSPEDGSSLW